MDNYATKIYQQNAIDELLERLCKYIQKENKKGKKLFGGIVANTNPYRYKGRWIYFNKPSKKLKNNFANWEDLGL
ncbi:hypothetical protein J7J12_00555 [bacterium]|nr:hypothetical protein [bacterium]